MKQLIVLVGLVLSVMSSGSASAAASAPESESLQNAHASSNAAYAWWPVQAQTVVSPYLVTVVAYNVWAAPIVCRGQVYAHSYYGGWGYLDVIVGPVYPGMSGYAYLQPVYGDAFVAAQSALYCTWY